MNEPRAAGHREPDSRTPEFSTAKNGVERKEGKKNQTEPASGACEHRQCSIAREGGKRAADPDNPATGSAAGHERRHAGAALTLEVGSRLVVSAPGLWLRGVGKVWALPLCWIWLQAEA